MKKAIVCLLMLVSSICMADDKVAPYSVVLNNKFGVPVTVSLRGNVSDKLVCTVAGVDQAVCHGRSGFDNVPALKPFVIPADSNLTLTVYPLTEGDDQYNGEVTLWNMWADKPGVCYMGNGLMLFEKATTVDITQSSFGAVSTGPCN